jgi:hypothetical protein
MEIQNLNLTEDFMKNGKDAIDYMQQMIDDLNLITGERKNFGKEAATKLEHISQDMFKNMNDLSEIIYYYGDI